MTTPETPASSDPVRSSSEPLSTLRGAGVNYNPRKVAHVAVGLVVVTLAVCVVVFTVAGAHQNSQINELRHDGVPVSVTVTNCLGLMGGSGSNAAGYSCTGSYTIHGTRYTQTLPGTDFHDRGAIVAATVVPSDPALISPDNVLRSQHASFSVFVLPLILLVVLALVVGFIAFVRQRRRDATDTAAADATP